jgi:hypothetical protein
VLTFLIPKFHEQAEIKPTQHNFLCFFRWQFFCKGTVWTFIKLKIFDGMKSCWRKLDSKTEGNFIPTPTLKTELFDKGGSTIYWQGSQTRISRNGAGSFHYNFMCIISHHKNIILLQVLMINKTRVCYFETFFMHITTEHLGKSLYLKFKYLYLTNVSFLQTHSRRYWFKKSQNERYKHWIKCDQIKWTTKVT